MTPAPSSTVASVHVLPARRRYTYAVGTRTPALLLNFPAAVKAKLLRRSASARVACLSSSADQSPFLSVQTGTVRQMINNYTAKCDEHRSSTVASASPLPPTWSAAAEASASTTTTARKKECRPEAREGW